MTIMVLLFSMCAGIGYHPVLTLHSPQPVFRLGSVLPRPVAHPIIVTGRR